ncbi:MAG TPA: hypothetical protein VN222_09275 [Novosphingobium sp.]|nr:hypothetical protein [Novosphingobium sp.]
MDRYAGEAPEGSGACEGALERIDAALARFDAALARQAQSRLGMAAEAVALEVRNERLREAVDNALRDIDRLIGQHAPITPAPFQQ